MGQRNSNLNRNEELKIMETICHRMIYLYHLTLPHSPIQPFEYPNHPLILRNLIDHIINQIQIQNLPESFENIWMEDKFAYMTWIRDQLVKDHVKLISENTK